MLTCTAIALLLCSIFYAILCIFSLVTGLIYMSGKRELNPLELSQKTVDRLDTPEKKTAFAKKMGLVTFIVGIVQGITAWAICRRKGKACYGIALGFTAFSIGSVAVKLKGKISAFPLMKSVFYVTILGVLLCSRKEWD